MTDAIEAGAVEATNRIAKIVSMSPEIRDDVHGIIQEALAGFAPASAVAEMRERCAKVADDSEQQSRKQIDHNNEYYRRSGTRDTGANQACDLSAGTSKIIAAAIRQLDTAPARHHEITDDQIKHAHELAEDRRCAWADLAPASGDYVVVPREPTREQLDALSVACRETWGVNVDRKRPMPFYTSEWRERMKPIYRAAMLPAAGNVDKP